MGKSRGWGTSAVLAAGLGLVIGLVPPGVAARAASPPPVSVYPLGDSITFGLSGPDTATPGGYRGYVESDLSAARMQIAYQGTSTANPPVSTDQGAFRHDGHPGFRIDQVESDLHGYDPSSGSDGGQWMTGGSGHSSIHPDVVVLLIGTNDILQAFDPSYRFPGGYNSADSGQRARFVGDMDRRLWGLLLEISHLDSGKGLVLCTIPPMGLQTHDATAIDYDRALRDQLLPEARLWLGMRVELADVEGVFTSQSSPQPELMGPDGVHPTPLGYSRMAGVIANAVIDVRRLF